jgi:hypothetical protein
MKYCLAAMMVFCSVNGYTQSFDETTFIKQHITGNGAGIFIFCRGTKSKPALIAKAFNISDTDITHIGIGFFENNRSYIYHVTDQPGELGTALKMDSAGSFIETGEAGYFSIWKCKAGPQGKGRLKKILECYRKRKIYFDALFRLQEDDTLYCSEFCARVLKKLNSIRFKYKPRRVVLSDPFYQSYLERKQLCYFPVDFYQASKQFKKIAEYRFP